MSTLLQRCCRRYESLIQFVALFMIPGAVAVSTYIVTSSAERSKTQQEYIRIATGILSQKVSQKVEDGKAQAAIRTWAADVLQRYSPVSITDQQRQDLISGVGTEKGDSHQI